ncbi:anti-sigma factor antagonist [Actinomadura sp. KC216]|nr:anti-sigma factor antagonist [Actinomadura sp. KC216]
MVLTVGSPRLTRSAAAAAAPAPADLLGIRTEQRGHAVIVYLDGEIDHRGADRLRDHVQALIADPACPSRVILDLAQVHFCGSSGLGAVITVWRSVRIRRRSLVVSRPSGVCRRILERTGLDQHIALSPTLRHALTRPD